MMTYAKMMGALLTVTFLLAAQGGTEGNSSTADVFTWPDAMHSTGLPSSPAVSDTPHPSTLASPDNQSSSANTPPGGPPPPLNATQGGDVFTVANVSCDMSANISQEADNRTCPEGRPPIVGPPAQSASRTALDYVGYVSVPLLLVAGLTGNLLTVMVMFSKHFRHMSVSLLLIALATSDTTLIVLLPFTKLYTTQLLGLDIRTVSLASCKAFYFFWRCAKMTSSWFVVLICLERFIAVWFPLKTSLICTKRNTTIAIACVYLFMFSYNGYWTEYSALVKGRCEPYYVTPQTKKISRALLLTGVTLYSLIPTALLMIITPSICYKLLVVGRQRRSMTQSSAKGQKAATNTGRTTVMLIGVSLAYIILVAPVSIGHIVSSLTGESFFYSKDLGMTVLRETAQVMEQMNYSINFFLYVICSKSFRKRVVEFLGCGLGAQWRRGTSASASGKNGRRGQEKSVDTAVSSCSNPTA